MIDWTINLGHLLTFAGLMGSGLAVFYTMRSDVRLLQREIVDVKEAIKQIGTILITIGRQDERINAIAQDISDLRRGRGFINNP